MFLRLSIFLISFSSLGYEILLTRLFSIVHWHHFAYMILSLALLGFGASGTFLTLIQGTLRLRWRQVFFANICLLAIAMLGCFYLAVRIPFNALEILWNLKQSLYLFWIYLVLALPFFFAANAIGMTFMRYPDQIGSFYRFDLMGAGLGGLGILGILFLLPPWTALKVLSILALLAGFSALGDDQWSGKRWKGLIPLGVVAALLFLFPTQGGSRTLSEYKGLRMILQVPDTKIIHEASSPLGWLTVVESPTIPFRHAPGLSLHSQREPPLQLGIFTDGDAMTPITAFSGNLEEVDYLDYQSAAAPYHLLQDPRVLILGGGGGSGVLLALLHDAQAIDVAELNPQILNLLQDTFRDFSGKIYQEKRVHAHLAEARAFVSHSKKDQKKYDLIEISLLDSFGTASAGLYALSENYLYTVEALEDYLNLLKPNGYLAITRWMRLPPRDSFKLFSTALEALKGSRIAHPEQHLALIRSWKTTTLLVKKSPLTSENLMALKEFCKNRSFDLAYYPGMPSQEANRYNQLDQAYFFEGIQKIIGKNANQFFEDYKFNVRPARDDRPFFFHFLKWETFPELFSLRGQGGLPLIEWGYPVLIAVLVQAILASFFLVLLPLFWLRRKIPRGRGWVNILLYFLALGLSFLFLEMAFIQKFILFLGHPLYSIAVVISAFLVFAGLGSGFSARWSDKTLKGIAFAVVMIAVIGLSYLFLLPGIFSRSLGLPEPWRIALSILLIAPIAFFMGMPFPLGLTLLGKKLPQAIPWAWGINGCASVLSSVLAALLALHFGFTVVIVLALVLYLMAPVFLISLKQNPPSEF